ncbi:MAG: alpha/beta hydrolase [Flavobacteriia bacterium]|nr:alpha/beta hydrolase [Flavobacteriia bacterium]
MKKYILLLILGWSFGAAAQFTLTTDSIHREEFDPGQGTISPLTNAPDNTPKVVYWIHGLSGNSQSWSRVQEVTDGDDTVPGYPIRRSFGYVVDYSGQENRVMDGLAGWVHGEVENWRSVPARTDTLNRHTDIIVAHSQGGIVARTMRKRHLQDSARFPLPIKHIATFGTPHGGAMIINSTRPSNGEAQKWINVGCNRLSAAEIQTFVGSVWWLDQIVSPGTVQRFASVTCNGLNKTVLPIIVDSFRKPSAADFAVGANHLNNLRNVANRDSIAVVAFYGIEEEPVLWRNMGSLTFTKDTSLSGSILTTNPFGLNDDDQLPDFINGKIQDYRVKQYRTRDYQQRKIYKGAESWLETANLSWKRLIGARFDSIYQDGYLCVCGLNGMPFKVSSRADCYATCPPPPPSGTGRFSTFEDLLNYYIGITPNIVHHVTEIPNDGLVTGPTQVDYPGSFHVKMEGANHAQMRNMPQTRDGLKKLFNGDYGRGFTIPKR